MYLDWAILQYSFRRQKMIDKIKENWEKILLILREEYGDQITDISYKTWLEPLKPYSFKGKYHYHHCTGAAIYILCKEKIQHLLKSYHLRISRQGM